MSDYKALLKHSRNYLIANIATKALAFISIPIYTRLMSVSDYGIVNVFISIISFSPIIMTMNTEVAIGRYYFDADDIEDFKRFVGCSIIISSLFFLLTSVIALLFLSKLSVLLTFPTLLTLSVIPVSLYKVTNNVFVQIYNPMLESKKIAFVSSVQAYLAFALSIIAVIMMPSDKYYGYVIGNVIAMVLLCIYLYKQVRYYVSLSFQVKHIKYLLTFCLPYLPYSLSGIIIAQFGKLIISSSSGFISAGLYSFASNISLVMIVFIGLIHQAWNPFYFRYMNAKDYTSIDMDYDLIWRLTLILGCLLSLFSCEVGVLFGKTEYIVAIRIIPILVLGYIFYQWAFVYMRNASYAKQTIWMGAAVVSSGVSNIVMSLWMVPILADIGAALAFMISYIIMLVLTYIINKFILKEYSPKVRSFLPPFLLAFLVLVGCFLLNRNVLKMDLVIFFSKLVVTGGIAYILLKPYQEKVKLLILNSFRKR